jgi:hypothetical protein
LGELTSHLLAKDIFLAEANDSGSFWISDHPVVLHNDNPSPPHRSNLGFAVSGIQIYLPISSTQALAFFCPTLKREMEQGLQNIADKVTKAMAGHRVINASGEGVDLAQLQRMKQNLSSHFDEMYGQRKACFNKDNIVFVNSCQVRTAHRFLASRDNDFSLATEMIEKHPELKAPNLIQFG